MTESGEEPAGSPSASNGLLHALLALVGLLATNMLATWTALWVLGPLGDERWGVWLLRGLLSMTLTGLGFLSASVSVRWARERTVRAAVCFGLAAVYLVGVVVLRQAGLKPLLLYPRSGIEGGIGVARVFAAAVVNAAVVLTIAYGALGYSALRSTDDAASRP